MSIPMSILLFFVRTAVTVALIVLYGVCLKKLKKNSDKRKKVQNSEEYERIYAALKSKRDYPKLLSEGRKIYVAYAIGTLFMLLTWLLLSFVPFYRAEVAEGALVSNFSLCDVFTTPGLEDGILGNDIIIFYVLCYILIINLGAAAGMSCMQNDELDRLLQEYCLNKEIFKKTVSKWARGKSDLSHGAVSAFLSLFPFVVYVIMVLLLKNTKPEAIENLEQINLMTFCSGVNILIFLPFTSFVMVPVFYWEGSSQAWLFRIKARKMILSSAETEERRMEETVASGSQMGTFSPPPEDKHSGEQ